VIYFRAQHTLAHILFQTLGYRPSVSFVFQIFLDKFNFIGIRLLRLRLLSVLKFDFVRLYTFCVVIKRTARLVIWQCIACRWIAWTRRWRWTTWACWREGRAWETWPAWSSRHERGRRRSWGQSTFNLFSRCRCAYWLLDSHLQQVFRVAYTFRQIRRF